MTRGASWLSDAEATSLVREYGSPLHVYHEGTLRARLRGIAGMLAHRPFHPSISVKANGNPHLLAIARQEGLRGDAMSPGEILLLERAGFGPDEIFFIPNNVSEDELGFAHGRGILTSLDSLDQLRAWCALFPGTRIALRINPGTGDGHHEKVVTAGARTKFGIVPEELGEARGILESASVRLSGINQHIGSGFLEPSRYLASAETLLAIAETLPELDFVDFGGGFGIPYRENEEELDLASLGSRLDSLLRTWTARNGRTIQARVEPGRYWCAECGVLLGTVHATKTRGGGVVAGTDLGFNVLQRVVLYDAYHRIELVSGEQGDRETVSVIWVGDICESGDVLGRDRVGPMPRKGDVVRVRDTGAYGWSMSSSYNARPRAAELLRDAAGQVRCVRRRETWEDLMLQIP